MAYIVGLKQRIYAELFDTLFQGCGNLAVQPSNEMFMRANPGSHLTNMTGQGQLASDNTFVILGMSSSPVFYTLRATANSIVTRSAVSPTSSTAEDVQWNIEQMTLIQAQLLFTLMVGEKPEWQGQCRFVPSAAGIAGAVSVSSSAASGDTDIGNLFINNGDCSYDSLLRLAKPAIISPRQQFKVLANFAAQGTVTAGTGTTLPNDILNYLNAANVADATVRDYKSLVYRLLGTLLRHVL